MSFIQGSEKYLDKHHSNGILFTNGVYLEKYLAYLPHSMTILLNLNTPSAMTEMQYKQLENTLQKLYILGWLNTPKATIGCNLCMEIDDYDFIWKIVDKYNIKHIRTSVTAPTKLEYKNNKDQYYLDMLPKFLSFVKEADKRNVELGKDCNYIPYCYFNDNDLKLVTKVLKSPEGRDREPQCGPVIDITPDFTASACFGAYNVVDCAQFKNFTQLRYYLLHKNVMPRFIQNNSGRCKNCKKHELLQCQGGCLAFSQVKED